MNFSNRKESIEAYVIDIRRRVHMYPELPSKEINTSALVKHELKTMGIELANISSGTSVVGLIRGKLPGPAVALRAELDALPIQEETDHAWKSRIPGVMHACGHDVHLACLLGASRLLNEVSDDLPGTVYLIFQSAEENCQGAKELIRAGVLNLGFEAMFGLHTNTELEVGKVAFLSGPSQAGADSFSVKIHGIGGHGAFPHATVDPVVIAAQIVSQFQTIISRSHDPMHSSVLSVCRINAGNSDNIIPETAELGGTIRTMDSLSRSLIIERMRQICDGMAIAYNCICKIEIVPGPPPVVNDPALVSRAVDSCTHVLGPENVAELRRAMVGDDIAEFTARIPGVLGALGVRNEQKSIVSRNHTPNFDVDEQCISLGAVCMAQMAFDYLCDITEPSSKPT